MLHVYLGKNLKSSSDISGPFWADVIQIRSKEFLTECALVLLVVAAGFYISCVQRAAAHSVRQKSAVWT